MVEVMDLLSLDTCIVLVVKSHFFFVTEVSLLLLLDSVLAIIMTLD